MTTLLAPTTTPDQLPTTAAAISIRSVERRFGDRFALRGPSLDVIAGQVHALLGRNGAGKTTLMRILSGLLDPDSGEISLLGEPVERLSWRRARQLVGLVPSGDRTFYLRISGAENLRFFARLHGLRRSDAIERAERCLEEVGLAEAGALPVSAYSHGMQKRLSVARALLMAPPVLLIDEATHDLDPYAARTVRDLVAARARSGAAVLWATQRIDEIRGFADRVTVLDGGAVRFAGSVPELMAVARTDRHLLELRPQASVQSVQAMAAKALDGLGTLTPHGTPGGEHFLLARRPGVILGDAIAALARAGIGVQSCREDRSGIEAAFLLLTAEDGEGGESCAR